MTDGPGSRTNRRPEWSDLPAGGAAAAGFLTVLPVPERWAEQGRPWATVFFPLVGLVLGGGVLLVRQASQDPTLAGVLGVTALALATGGLHWDAWADVLDATLTPGLPRSRRLEILSDARVGAHATVGVALLVLLRAHCLGHAPGWAVLAGLVFGRWVVVATLRWTPPLREHGSGAALASDARPIGALLVPVALGSALVALGVPVRHLALAVGAGSLVAVLATGFVLRRLSGMNGDGHGAVGLLAETAVWTAALELAARTGG